MSFKKHTAVAKMDTISLTCEHKKLDVLIGKHQPHRDGLGELGFENINHAKLRRCQLKTELQSRMKRGDQDAIGYGKSRKWQVTVPA